MKEKELKAIFNEAIEKYHLGEIEHGELDVTTDPRSFTDEIIKEYLDIINYSAFMIKRLRNLKEAINKNITLFLKDNKPTS